MLAHGVRILNNNAISIIEDGAFSGLTHLAYLCALPWTMLMDPRDLSDNLISTISNATFSSLQNLELLYTYDLLDSQPPQICVDERAHFD